MKLFYRIQNFYSGKPWTLGTSVVLVVLFLVLTILFPSVMVWVFLAIVALVVIEALLIGLILKIVDEL